MGFYGQEDFYFHILVHIYEDFLEKNELPPEIFFKTSSKTGENIEIVFAALSDLLYARVIQLNV